MKVINNVSYYNKEEICKRIGITIHTLNTRIKHTQIRGYNFGKWKYYTEEQIQILATYQKPL